MRLPNTPFPDFPVGSLLAVLAKPNTEEILDVQVILPERFTIVFQEPAELYFVVNDRSCAQSRGQLTVELVHMKPAETAMRQLGDAMKSLRDAIRQEGDSLAFQGRLLPSQTAQFRAMAWQKLSEACRCETESYPSAVRGFYSLWIETEVARVERQVEILALQRRTRQLIAELESIAVEVESEQRQGKMGSRLATLALNSLDLDLLHGDSISLTHLIQTRLMPFIELRYPETVSGPEGFLNVEQDRHKLERLTELDWTTPVFNYIDDVGQVAKTIVDHLEMAAGTAPEVVSKKLVVAFRNPYADAPATGELPLSLKWIDDARAYDIWNSIQTGERIFLELRPEDIYGRSPVSVDCTLVTPIITALALYVGREGEPASDALNAMKWEPNMRAETRMVFPAIDGQRVLHFANADWLRKPVRFLYGPESQALARFHEIAQKETTGQGGPYDSSLVGISPFTRFVVENFTFKDGNNKYINLANPIKGPDGKPDATSLMLILQLEARSDSREVKGVRTCLPQN